MSLKCIPVTPLNPTFIYSKTGVCRGIPIFDPKHRLWILIAVLMCTHNQCFEQKIKNIKNLLMKFSFFAYRIIMIKKLRLLFAHNLCVSQQMLSSISVITELLYSFSTCFYFSSLLKLSHHMRKPTICICENKGADQLRGNREADQLLCFRYTDI